MSSTDSLLVTQCAQFIQEILSSNGEIDSIAVGEKLTQLKEADVAFEHIKGSGIFQLVNKLRKNATISKRIYNLSKTLLRNWQSLDPKSLKRKQSFTSLTNSTECSLTEGARSVSVVLEPKGNILAKSTIPASSAENHMPIERAPKRAKISDSLQDDPLISLSQNFHSLFLYIDKSLLPTVVSRIEYPPSADTACGDALHLLPKNYTFSCTAKYNF